MTSTAQNWNALNWTLVTNLDASIAYYVDVLGFKLDWIVPFPDSEDEDETIGTAYVFRGYFELLMRTTDPPIHPSEVVVGMPSTTAVDAIDQEYVAAGAEILEHPFRRAWGTYEMRVVDPDGNLLRILN